VEPHLNRTCNISSDPNYSASCRKKRQATAAFICLLRPQKRQLAKSPCLWPFGLWVNLLLLVRMNFKIHEKTDFNFLNNKVPFWMTSHIWIQFSSSLYYLKVATTHLLLHKMQVLHRSIRTRWINSGLPLPSIGWRLCKRTDFSSCQLEELCLCILRILSSSQAADHPKSFCF